MASEKTIPGPVDNPKKRALDIPRQYPGVCIVEGCTRHAYPKVDGKCMKHGKRNSSANCSIDGCNRMGYKGDGKCHIHGKYERRPCSIQGCNRFAYKIDGKCAIHGKYTRCIKCETTMVSPHKTFIYTCAACSGRNHAPDERRIKNMLTLWYGETAFIHNKPIEFQCLKYRTDFTFQTSWGFLFVEVDEHGHRQYEPECEVVRMLNIQQTYWQPTVWIRFNPHLKSCYTGSLWRARMRILKETIDRYLDPEYLPTDPISPVVIYMGYNEDREYKLRDIMGRKVVELTKAYMGKNRSLRMRAIPEVTSDDL